MESSVLAFATDLLDEGADTFFGNLTDRAGVGGVTLASVYHEARDVFPHNPRRVIRYLEPGAAYFLSLIHMRRPPRSATATPSPRPPRRPAGAA